jgi:hypothetical protein
VALWLVIDPCVNFGRVYCDFLVYIFYSSIFLRHQTMDKVRKYNSFNTNTPSSESYRNYLRNSLPFMKPEGSLLRSYEPTTSPIPRSYVTLRNKLFFTVRCYPLAQPSSWRSQSPPLDPILKSIAVRSI